MSPEAADLLATAGALAIVTAVVFVGVAAALWIERQLSR